MKKLSEYKSMGFPNGYLRVGDLIDMELAMFITDASVEEDWEKYDRWENGVIQSRHPADVIGSVGVYDTIERNSIYEPFRYQGQCPAGAVGNRNMALARRVYICSRFRSDSTEGIVHNVQVAKKYCRMVMDRGDLPIATHLYFTQFLDDRDFMQRNLGMSAGLLLLRHADVVLAIIEDGEISVGMDKEMREAANLGIPIEKIYIGRQPGKVEKG